MRRLALACAVVLFAGCPEGQTIVRNIEAACGNGVVDDLEACDDGNREPGDACTNDCQVATCGDKVLRTDLTPGEVGAESCDDGNEVDTDACTNMCQVATCGDGQRRLDLSEGEAGYEACDDANTVDEDACESNCRIATAVTACPPRLG